ncbi:hypothetical protein [Acinetobacter junii]|uniref:hypothetical protein n=5 Tax=Acinetobacter junii TaxID=40215 RepID=UPI00148F3A9C|nr:hypothetical protein [Acinetobacter junii]
MQQTFLKNNDCNQFFVSFFYQFKQRIILTVKILKAFNLLSKHTGLLGFAKSLAKIFKTINYLKFIQISYLEKIDELFREIKKAPEGTAVPQISQEEPQLRFFLFSPFFIRHKE